MSLRGRHAKHSVTPTSRFLIVTVGGVQFALLTSCVEGLLTADEAGPGDTMTIQGLTYPHIDLAGRLQLPTDTLEVESRCVLFSAGQARASIRVAQVHGLKELAQSQVLPLPRHFQGEEQRWYQGMILFETTVALVLNPVWVLEGGGAAQGMTTEAAPKALAPSLTWRPAIAGGHG
jgi:chemotaxis protein histidine kinase CheA